MGRISYYGEDDSVLSSEGIEPPSNQNLKDFVSGDYEIVYVFHNGRRAQLIVNADGHILQRPINKNATVIYHAWSLHKNGELPEHTIAGPAVLLEDDCMFV